jgi:hypothetical protein
MCVAAATLQAFGQSANSNLSNLTAPTAVNVPLLPQADSSIDLGSSARSWRNLFVDGRSYLKTAYSYFNTATNQFRINNAGDRLVINNSGYVGIGTTLPNVRLHVSGGADVEPGSGGFIVTGSTTSTNIGIDDNEIMARNNGAVSTLYFNNDGGDVVMCTSSGNVMIGTTTPATGYILSVDGKVMAEEVRVQLSGNWPDYVFDEKYQLPSLYNLETAVKTNKHLPGIPSAEEMKKNGITVGEMQTKMMEKIEELTLYIISLQKQIDELKKTNN